MEAAIVIDYAPRRQFLGFHARPQRWACIVAHRRAGKTVACVNDQQRGALTASHDRYRAAYIAPTYRQAKAVAWDYARHAAGPLMRYGATVNESELRIDYPNGAQLRLFGADNYEALRGLGLDDAVLDEAADFDPRAWPEVIRPALADRRGRATFIGTPKGRNFFHDIYKRSLTEADWFSLLLKASETGLIGADELASARLDLSEDQYAQEFECSFEAAIVGSYYGKLINQAEQDNRITGVPYEPTAQVWTAWDLGIRDATAIWFAQVVGREIRLIDYYEASGADLGHYVNQIRNRAYVYAGHIVPHDAQAKELGTGKSRLEVLESLGMKNLQVAPMHRVEDGINAARVMLPKCWIDKTKCERGIEAMRLYRSEYDDKLKALRPRPVHDWTSHAADSFRYLAMTLDRQVSVTGFNRQIEYPRMGLA